MPVVDTDAHDEVKVCPSLTMTMKREFYHRYYKYYNGAHRMLRLISRLNMNTGPNNQKS
jgi:hypothetical protein